MDGPVVYARQLNKKRRSQGQEAAQDSEPAPPEPPKRQYPKTYGFDDDDLAEGYFKEYSKSLKFTYAYNNKLRAVKNRLSSIYKNYTENEGYLTEAEAFQMKNARALSRVGEARARAGLHTGAIITLAGSLFTSDTSKTSDTSRA